METEAQRLTTFQRALGGKVTEIDSLTPATRVHNQEALGGFATEVDTGERATAVWTGREESGAAFLPN
jgi:hypothetical protein